MSHCLGLSSSFESFIRQTSSLTFRGVKGNASFWFSNKPVSVSKHRPSMVRRLAAYFLFIVCGPTARAMTFVVEVQRCLHGATELRHRENTHLHGNVVTVPMYLWCNEDTSLGGFVVLSMWTDWKISWGLCGDSPPHVRGLWELFWSGLSRAPGWCFPVIVAIPAAPHQQLVVVVWQVWSTVQTLWSGYGLCLHWQGVKN